MTRYRLPRARLSAVAVTLLALASPAVAAAASPSVVGSVSDAVHLSGVRAVAVSGNYAYSPSYYSGELTAIDISNPAQPKIVGESTASAVVDNADFVTVSGGYAYVTSKNANGTQGSNTNDNGTGNSLSIFDIHTDPTHPALVGSISDTSAATNHLFGAYGVAVSGHYAFVTAQGCLGGEPCPDSTVGNSLNVIDVSNPARPTLVSSLSGGSAFSHADSVSLAGNFAYVTASYSNTLTVVDISTPTSPHIAGTLQDATNLAFPNDVAVQGNYAYVANQTSPSGSLAVVDVSNPASPHVAATLSDPALAYAYFLRVRGSFAYVAAARAAAIDMVDVSNPLAPKLVGSVQDSAHLNHTTGVDFALTGRYIVSSSPLLSSESQTQYPAYPLQPGGPTNTGTVSVLDVDPNPVAVRITAPMAVTYKQGQKVLAAYTCTAGGLFPLTACQGPAASGAAIDTSSPGKHTFTVTGTDQAGRTGSATVTYSVQGPPPRVSHVHQKSRRWREHGKRARHRPPIGTVFTFTLSEKASVKLSFARHLPGRRSGRRCVAPTRHNRHHRGCVRLARAVTLTLSGRAGRNRLAFRGKIRGHYLKPGTYTLTITATANGQTVKRTLTFTIVG